MLDVNTAKSCDSHNTVIGNKKGVHVIEIMTIQQSVERLYRAWRDFESLPKYLHHVDSVQVLDDQHTRWSIVTPVGLFQWTAILIEDKPNELISWKTEGEADVNSAGSVRFLPIPNSDATELIVNLRYDVIGGRALTWLTSLFGNSPEDVIREDLRRFKQFLETGSFATTEA